jgi:hypothetical protein
LDWYYFTLNHKMYAEPAIRTEQDNSQGDAESQGGQDREVGCARGAVQVPEAAPEDLQCFRGNRLLATEMVAFHPTSVP